MANLLRFRDSRCKPAKGKKGVRRKGQRGTASFQIRSDRTGRDVQLATLDIGPKQTKGEYTTVGQVKTRQFQGAAKR